MDRSHGLPRDRGETASPAEPDPAPERGEAQPVADPRDRGGTGQPVGSDNIIEGRVDGVLVPPGSTQGQGEGG
jgi:hypothetical protein